MYIIYIRIHVLAGEISRRGYFNCVSRGSLSRGPLRLYERSREQLIGRSGVGNETERRYIQPSKKERERKDRARVGTYIYTRAEMRRERASE